MAQIQTLLDKLGYQFQDSDLLTEALSHRSSGRCNYERLEFLGDSLLNFVIATELFHHRCNEDEGALSRLRASLVRQSTLAQIARELQLGEHLNLGVGELRSGGFNRDSILSDVVESLIGAVFIEAGYDRARALILPSAAHCRSQICMSPQPPAVDEKPSKPPLSNYLKKCKSAIDKSSGRRGCFRRGCLSFER